MIKINHKRFTTAYYPDKTVRLLIEEQGDALISWNYENDAEMFTVIALAQKYHELGKRVALKLPYIPNARMDRIKSPKEVFTLKTFCDLINSCDFDYVEVLDAHSPVSLALLNRVRQTDIAEVIKRAALGKLPKDIILYFPDEGSQKRYAELFPDYRSVVGMKKRDWSSGKIGKLEILSDGIDLHQKTVLMIDDIISYGGSLYYSALRLKELGAGDVFAYATHTEMSILDEEKGKLKKLLLDGTVKKLFTTDSIFKGSMEQIEIIEV